MSQAINVQSLQVRLDQYDVLSDLNFTIDQGNFVYILGDNGSGKTTLIKTILGLIKPTSGSISIFEQPLSQDMVAQHIAYVPQRSEIDRTFPMSVEEMIRLECEHAHTCELGADGHLEAFASSELKSRRISQLSGGEFQRVLIARALVTSPDILILDEPFNNLDKNIQETLYLLLQELNSEGKTIIVITHDHNLISQDSKLLLLEQGRILTGDTKQMIHDHLPMVHEHAHVHKDSRQMH